MQALTQSLTRKSQRWRRARTARARNIYQTLGAVAQIDNVDNIHVTNSHWTGGAIANATITGGSIFGTSLSAGDLTGVIAIAHGGTGTPTAPSYGKVLLGNASGAYDLVATSSLGISSGGSGISFGKSWEIANGALAPTTTLGVCGERILHLQWWSLDRSLDDDECNLHEPLCNRRASHNRGHRLTDRDRSNDHEPGRNDLHRNERVNDGRFFLRRHLRRPHGNHHNPRLGNFHVWRRQSIQLPNLTRERPPHSALVLIFVGVLAH